MKMKTLSLTLGLSGTALAAALVLPALAQESLLPEGFGNPAETPAPRPTPTPSPTATPTPGSPPVNGTAPPPVAPTVGTTSASASAETGEEGEDGEEVESGGLKYDLPPGARRLLTRIGPLTPETGGLAPDAFGVRGQYAAAIMGKTNGQFASRWGQILLRRSLASAIDTPDTINGADLAAARTALLLRMGESIIARRIVQSVDYDRASPRLVAAAQQTYLANADPAGMCPYVPAGLAHGDEQAWRLSSAICSGLSGEAGPAGWAIGRVRSSGKISNFDILLTERVLGATGAGRRSTTIEWDNIDRLTSWRFGMATATAIPVPEALRTAAPSNIKSWTVLAPMTDMASRIAAAPEAAARGVLSSEAYVSLLSAAASEEEPAEAIVTQTDQLRGAFRLAAGADRYAAMQQLWGMGGTPVQSYAAMVATARAAAALPVNTEVGGDPWQLLGSMLAGGYDENAIAWVPTAAPAYGHERGRRRPVCRRRRQRRYAAIEIPARGSRRPRAARCECGGVGGERPRGRSGQADALVAGDHGGGRTPRARHGGASRGGGDAGRMVGSPALSSLLYRPRAARRGARSRSADDRGRSAGACLSA